MFIAKERQKIEFIALNCSINHKCWNILRCVTAQCWNDTHIKRWWYLSVDTDIQRKAEWI